MFLKLFLFFSRFQPGCSTGTWFLVWRCFSNDNVSFSGFWKKNWSPQKKFLLSLSIYHGFALSEMLSPQKNVYYVSVWYETFEILNQVKVHKKMFGWRPQKSPCLDYAVSEILNSLKLFAVSHCYTRHVKSCYCFSSNFYWPIVLDNFNWLLYSETMETIMYDGWWIKYATVKMSVCLMTHIETLQTLCFSEIIKLWQNVFQDETNEIIFAVLVVSAITVIN